MTNYLQLLAAAMAFNLHFPDYMTSSLSGASKVGGSSGILLSFDCLLMEVSITESFDNVAYLKVTILALIPIIMITLAVIIFRLFFITNTGKFIRYL
jgi:hypothetical protein